MIDFYIVCQFYGFVFVGCGVIGVDVCDFDDFVCLEVMVGYY